MESKGIIADFGLSLYSSSEIQKIAILDIRILNCDRNDGNILVKEEKNKLKLIPIDHGLSFSDTFEIYEDYIFWMNLPQSKEPLTQAQL